MILLDGKVLKSNHSLCRHCEPSGASEAWQSIIEIASSLRDIAMTMRGYIKKGLFVKNKRKQINLIMLASFIFAVAVATYFYVPKFFADEVYPLKYENFIRTYSVKYNVDPTLVAAVILQESRFNPSSVSGAGAQGLMQFMPGTAATMAKETGRWPTYDIFDAETSVEFGAAHLRDLLVKYNGNIDLALYAYNTGTGNAAKYVGSPSSIANFSYVKKIRNYQVVYKTMYATELGVEPVKLQTATAETRKNEVRGFVWSQIFTNFATYFDKKQ